MIQSLNPINYISFFKKLNLETIVAMQFLNLPIDKLFQKIALLKDDYPKVIIPPEKIELNQLVAEIFSPVITEKILTGLIDKEPTSFVYFLLSILDDKYRLKFFTYPEHLISTVRSNNAELIKQIEIVPVYDKIKILLRKKYDIDKDGSLFCIFQELQKEFYNKVDTQFLNLKNFSLNDLVKYLLALITDDFFKSKLAADTLIYIPILESNYLDKDTYNFIFLITCIAFLNTPYSTLQNLNLKLANHISSRIPSDIQSTFQFFR